MCPSITRRLALVLALVLVALPALAQQTGPGALPGAPPGTGGTAFTGGAITSPILGPGGTCAAPEYSRSGDTNTGVSITATDTVSICAGGITAGSFTVPSGGASTSNFFNITGTIPAVPTSAQHGVDITITGAGSAAFNQRAMSVSLSAGYTGSSGTAGLRVTNASVGTGTGVGFVSANFGLTAAMTASTTGNNFAVGANASGSSVLNVGLSAQTVLGTNTPALNIGVWGAATLATANVGGFFGLLATVPVAASSAALIADNGAEAAPIFIARDNGTAAFTVGDGGIVTTTQEILAPVIAGCAASNVAYSFTGDTDTGFTSTGAGNPVICANATAVATWSTAGLTLPSGYLIDIGTSVRMAGGAAGLALFNTASSANAALLATYQVEVVTTTKTPSLFESRELYTNTGDTDGSTLTLTDNPTIGHAIWVAVVAAQTVTVQPSAGETLFLGGAACTTITGNDTGAMLQVIAVTGGSGGQWSTGSANGTWTCNP